MRRPGFEPGGYAFTVRAVDPLQHLVRSPQPNWLEHVKLLRTPHGYAAAALTCGSSNRASRVGERTDMPRGSGEQKSRPRDERRLERAGNIVLEPRGYCSRFCRLSAWPAGCFLGCVSEVSDVVPDDVTGSHGSDCSFSCPTVDGVDRSAGDSGGFVKLHPLV